MGPAHFIQPQQAIQYVECHDNATVFDYFQLERRDSSRGAKSSHAPRSSFGIIIPRCTPLSMLVKNFTAQKGSKTTPITCQIVSTNWTGHPSKCQEEIAFLEELIAYRKSQPTPSFEKRARDSRLL